MVKKTLIRLIALKTELITALIMFFQCIDDEISENDFFSDGNGADEEENLFQSAIQL